MLVLGRKKGEWIRVGDVRICVVEVKKNGYVKLGFEAPPEVKIVREELEVK